MNLLPHWVLTDKFPAFYDSESKTSIEQTARVYAAMQELITEYNKFVDNINNYISEFTNATNKDYEIFKVAMRQEFQDFIDVIDLKMKAQDKEIADAVDYMKTNLRVSIKELIAGLRVTGELNQDILDCFADFSEQITNESNARTQADEQLQQNITNESNARTQADEQLQQNITNESNARTQADEQLQQNITNESNARTQAFSELDERIKNSQSYYVTPLTYGAIGDGINDDTKAFQDALNENTHVFVPKGIYLITDTLTIKNKTFIFGTGDNTIIKMSENVDKDILHSENFDDLTDTDTVDNAKGLFVIKDLVLDGSYASDAYNNIHNPNKSIGRGLCIYGSAYYLDNVKVTNNPGCGIFLEHSTYNSPPFEEKLWRECIINNCVCSFNGEDGLYIKKAYDLRINNLTALSNSRKAHNTYCNVYAGNSSLRIVNSHFASLYGNIKPKYSLHVSSENGGCDVVGCHIEGAVAPLCIEGLYFNMTGGKVYATFGEHCILIGGGRNIFNNVVVAGQPADEIPQKPEFKSAFKIYNKVEMNEIDVHLEGIPFIDTLEDCGFHNKFILKGYYEGGVIDDPSCHGTWDINGYFGSKVNTHQRYETVNALGLNKVINLHALSMHGDMHLSTYFCVITEYTAGTLSANNLSNGCIAVVMNKTTSEIPAKFNNVSGVIKPNHNNFIVVDSVGNVHYN